MEIERDYPKAVCFKDFVTEAGLVLVLSHAASYPVIYEATFWGMKERLSDGSLRFEGTGETEDEAIVDLMERISGCSTELEDGTKISVPFLIRGNDASMAI